MTQNFKEAATAASRSRRQRAYYKKT